MNRLALTLLTVAPALAAAQFAYMPYKLLSSQSTPFRYYLDSRNANPAGLSLSVVQNATNNGATTWNAVSCAVPKLSFQGSSVGVVPNSNDPYDTYSVFSLWVLNYSDPDYNGIIGGPGIKGITLPLAYAGVLEQCDIFLNGTPDVAWSAAPTTPAGSLDLETIMLHEEGHCLGLDHYGFDKVMSANIVSGGARRVLTQDDLDAVCQRYPLAERIGSPCNADGGCGSSVPGIKCVTQPLAVGSAKFCTVGCATGTGATCEVSLSCQAATYFNPGLDGACLRSVNTVTQVGKACQNNTQCGSSVAACQQPIAQPSDPLGIKSGWVQGYCTQSCAAGQASCPQGSVCVPEVGNFCLQNCRLGLSDCRPYYSCVLSTTGPVCYPSCHGDVDCGNVNFTCRVCDGLCVAKQTAAAQIGDLCNVDGQCGPGQSCRALIDGNPNKICTLDCGKGCTSCPTGSTCQPIPPLNALQCVRTCTGFGTCNNGTQCGDLPTGKACLPPCRNEFDCAVGLFCNNGQCFFPDPDAGCEPFCTPDSGGPVGPGPKKDAGTGGGGTGGCGCGSTDGGALFALLALASRWRRSRRSR